MKKFLEDLEVELKKQKMSSDEINEILKDHQEMIDEAMQEGLSEEEIEKKFGDPAKLAMDLKEDFVEEVEIKSTNENGYNICKTFTLNEKDYDIQTNLVYEDVIYEIDLEDTIRVLYKGKEKIEKYTIEFNHNTFVLKSPRTTGINIFMSSKSDTQFLVKLPKNRFIHEMHHSSVSADVFISGLRGGSFYLKSTSGDIMVTAVLAKSIKIDTVSGDSVLNHVKSDTLQTSQVSGDIDIKNTKLTKDYSANTVSGDIQALHFECKSAVFRTVSGDISGKECYPEEISLKSVSGDIRLVNQDKTRSVRIVSNHSVSGDIEIIVK